jgi:hypothetical protein
MKKVLTYRKRTPEISSKLDCVLGAGVDRGADFRVVPELLDFLPPHWRSQQTFLYSFLTSHLDAKRRFFRTPQSTYQTIHSR